MSGCRCVGVRGRRGDDGDGFERGGGLSGLASRRRRPVPREELESQFGAGACGFAGRGAQDVGAADNGSGTGAAYVFTRSGTAWSQEAKLVVSGGPTELGQWVAISGSTAVIGAPTYNSDAGTAYVFAGV